MRRQESTSLHHEGSQQTTNNQKPTTILQPRTTRTTRKLLRPCRSRAGGNPGPQLTTSNQQLRVNCFSIRRFRRFTQIKDVKCVGVTPDTREGWSRETKRAATRRSQPWKEDHITETRSLRPASAQPADQARTDGAEEDGTGGGDRSRITLYSDQIYRLTINERSTVVPTVSPVRAKEGG